MESVQLEQLAGQRLRLTGLVEVDPFSEDEKVIWAWQLYLDTGMRVLKKYPPQAAYAAPAMEVWLECEGFYFYCPQLLRQLPQQHWAWVQFTATIQPGADIALEQVTDVSVVQVITGWEPRIVGEGGDDGDAAFLRALRNCI